MVRAIGALSTDSAAIIMMMVVATNDKTGSSSHFFTMEMANMPMFRTAMYIRMPIPKLMPTRNGAVKPPIRAMMANSRLS